MKQSPHYGRRNALRSIMAASATTLLWPFIGSAKQDTVITKTIPSSGETLPVIGLGSWSTFNVGNDPAARDTCTEVLRNFFNAGGRMIDSSPMYGSSQ
jgi:hypothetical protein